MCLRECQAESYSVMSLGHFICYTRKGRTGNGSTSTCSKLYIYPPNHQATVTRTDTPQCHIGDGLGLVLGGAETLLEPGNIEAIVQSGSMENRFTE
jgi:hypothetical protein